jgi:hypothetical protein
MTSRADQRVFARRRSMAAYISSVALGTILLCSPAQAVTLACEIGFALKIGNGSGPPRRTYTLEIAEDADFVTAVSGKTSRRFDIVRRIETNEMRALVLDNDNPTVQAMLVLWPDPRLEISLGGGHSQTDVCKVTSAKTN